MQTPQNSIWGPELWTVLHSSAERIGSKSLSRLPGEELRIWSTLLSSLRYSLPCPQCKKHYTDYFSSHPMPQWNKDTMRRWLFELHQRVNEKNGKDNTFTIEQVEERYSQPFHFTGHVGTVRAQMMAGIHLKWVERTDIQRTIRILEELKRFYDFF